MLKVCPDERAVQPIEKRRLELRKYTMFAAVFAAAFCAAPAALAGDVTCNGFPFGNVTGPVNGNLIVPDSTICFANGTTINGNVTVGANSRLIFGGLTATAVTGNVSVGNDASLEVTNTAVFNGNLQGNNCNHIFLNLDGANTTSVGGSIQINNCIGPSFLGSVAFADLGPAGAGHSVGGNVQCNNNTGACEYENAIVGGNIQFNNNNSPASSQITNTTVTGNVQVNNNVGSSILINGNHITGNLQCQNNNPPPTGFNNTVGANPNQDSEGQCKGF
jgi:hypothetical protein